MDIPLFASGDDGPGDHPSGRTDSASGECCWTGWLRLGWVDLCSARPPRTTPPGAADPVDPEVEEMESLLQSRRRPSKLADALTRKAYRDYHRVQTGAHVKWIPKVEAVTAALDEAEASGKMNSSLGS